MKLKVTYLDGRYEEYDMGSMFNSSNLFGANVGCTRFTLCTDNLSQGLWVKYSYADAGGARQVRDRDNLCVPWVDEFDYQVLNVRDLSQVGTVDLDGELVLYRVEGCSTLVNGPKFSMMVRLYGSTADGQAACDTAVDLYRTLHGREASGSDAVIERMEGESDDAWNQRIADAMGWDVSSLLDLVAAADAQDELNAQLAEGVTDSDIGDDLAPEAVPDLQHADHAAIDLEDLEDIDLDELDG